MTVVMVVAKNLCRHAVDDQSDDRYENSAVERNRDRMDKAINALNHHEESEAGQEYGAREPSQRIYFAGTETEPRARCV